MRKTYCDLCGKEIKQQYRIWKYELQAQFGNHKISYDEKLAELCEVCATNLHFVTSMMKRGYRPDFHDFVDEEK